MPTTLARRPDAAAADRATGLALALAGSVAFSGKAIIVKLAYRHGVDAITLIMYRMVFALPFFLGLMWWAGRGRVRMDVRDRMAVWALGFSGYYLASSLDFLGLQYISASLERLILYLNPTLVLLLGWWLFGRRATRGQLLALAISYCGVLLVFGREARVEGQHVALGAALVFASTLSYAAYMLYSGEVLRRIGSLRLTGAASSVACVLCILQFLVLRPMSAAAVATPVLWLSVLNAVVCTVAPVLMVMMAIERVGPAVTAQAGMIGPISTILMSIWLLDEPFTPWLAAGTLCVMAGVGLMARGKR
ncbi:MAG: DMT family transporter [Ideonella sp.]|jgi:drug/metabolite transporter (DMT)-like permease|nr:DMT family transporter [Ideonella sp.]